MNNTLKFSLLIIAFSTAFSGCNNSDNIGRTLSIESETIATVNGVNILEAELDALLKTRSAVQQGTTREIGIEELISLELLRQQAIADQLHHEKSIAVKINQESTKVLASTVLQKLFETDSISDEDIRAEYDAYLVTLTDKEYKVRHILSRTEAEARNNIDDLNNGSKFIELAKDRSVDATSSNGGDLGWASPASFVEPFANAMVQLEAKSYTKNPVQSSYGWHVILVEDIRESTPPVYEEIKSQLANMVSNKRISDYIENLRAKASVKIVGKTDAPRS